MKLYFAPLEGITNYIYRNVHAEVFGGCDKYFAPFITPSDNEKVNLKGLKDVLIENNKTDICVQVLTKDADSFIKFAKKIENAGYDELNINLGCPYPTVVKKGKGAGFLLEPLELDEFLYKIFDSCGIKISIKTRAGFYSKDELLNLMEIYNKYPLSLLIIHPRAREDFYSGKPDIDTFEKAYEISKNKLCYNGDIFSKKDYDYIVKRFPDLDSIMIGRGAVINPALFREIKCGEALKKDELILFIEKLSQNYKEVLRSDVFTMHKIKEVLSYMLKNHPDEKKVLKSVKKANSLSELMLLLKTL